MPACRKSAGAYLANADLHVPHRFLFRAVYLFLSFVLLEFLFGLGDRYSLDVRDVPFSLMLAGWRLGTSIWRYRTLACIRSVHMRTSHSSVSLVSCYA